ncbi:MAG: uracil-DNA glycosylase [Acetobacteraceae bacterium]|nr:uracil-DNA glycosylase [Acetobacteraceae bacterium]
MEHADIALAALRLQLDWGADEALADAPIDRFAGKEPTASDRAPAVAGGHRDRPMPARPGPAAAPASILAAEAAASSAATLAGLRAVLERFEGCKLRDTATSLVWADGPDDARVMLVGDAPGPDEDRTGRPFAGATGDYLGAMLGSVGLTGAVRLTTLLPWRPPGGRPPTDSEVAVCLPFLLRHLALVRPDFLLIAGPQACSALAGDAARRMRRKEAPAWLDVAIPGHADIRALVIPPPGVTRRTPAARRDSWRALCALARAMNGR